MKAQTASSKGVEQAELSSYTKTGDSKVYFRVELPDRRYERVLSGNRHIDYVMVNQTDAERVVSNLGGFGEVLEPHHRLAVTGTEDDEIVAERKVYDDVDLLSQIQRDVVFIPDHGWLYGDTMDQDEQQAAVKLYLERLEKLCDLIEDEEFSHVTVVPLAKGFNRSHFEEIAKKFERLGFDRYAFYGVQTRSIRRLVEETRLSITVIDPEEVLLIGRGSPHDVAKLPSRVNAVASLRYWKDYSDLTVEGYSDSKLLEWKNMVKNAIENGRRGRQTRFYNFPEIGVGA